MDSTSQAKTQAQKLLKLRSIVRFFRLASLVLAGIWMLMVCLASSAGSGLIAIFGAVSFLCLLVTLTILTRTIPLITIPIMFIGGASLSYVGYFLGRILASIGIDYYNPLRSVLMPVIQTLLIMLPVAAFLFIGRKSTSRLTGISDIVLIAAAVGAGFAVPIDARIFTAYPNAGHFTVVSWFSYSLGGWQAEAGFGIWGAFAGLTLGLASLFWFRKAWTKQLVAIGLVLAALDQFVAHFDALNMYGRHQHWFADTLGGADLHGLLVPWLFILGLVPAITYEVSIISQFHRSSIPTAQSLLSLWTLLPDWKAMCSAWDRLLWTRRLAYLNFRAHRAGGELEKYNQQVRGAIASRLVP